MYESEESDDEAGAEDTTLEGLMALGRGRRLSFTTNLENKVEEFIAVNRRFADRHHEQKPSISPHTSEALTHWHVLFRDLLRHSLAAVILASHGFDGIYKKGRELL